MPAGSGIQFTVWLTTVCLGAALAFAAYAAASTIASGIVACALVSIVTLAVAFSLAAAIRIVNQWQRAIVLRLGKFSSVRGPVLFFITPLAETVAYVIDLRTITTPFRAEQTMTSDTVPVGVDAVLFWRVTDPQRAALEVEKYADAVAMAAQTALRDVIGRATLAAILGERQSIDKNLRTITLAWRSRSACACRDIAACNSAGIFTSRSSGDIDAIHFVERRHPFLYCSNSRITNSTSTRLRWSTTSLPRANRRRRCTTTLDTI